MSLVSGEPRSATVVAAVPTTAFELSRYGVAALIAEQPRILENLTRILTTGSRQRPRSVADSRSRGEAVALVVSDEAAESVSACVAATEAASPRPVATVDVRDSLDALETLDDLLANERDGADRRRPGQTAAEEAADRTVTLDEPPQDVAWLGRHLSRTKLGLALGAGGAKGYAHVAALRVLEDAGYTVDYVSGSSIGAMVGAWIALGRDSARDRGDHARGVQGETIDEIFKLSLTGGSTGLEAMTRLLRETTDDKTFDDLVIPFVAMTVDLNAQAPAPRDRGPALEGPARRDRARRDVPAQEQDGKRLVDGLALVPVPTDAVAELGADVTVAVNIISRADARRLAGRSSGRRSRRGARARVCSTPCSK